MKKNRTERNAKLYRALRAKGKLLFLAALCVTVLLSGLVLAGCNNGSSNQKPAGDTEEFTATLWFINPEYLETGDDSLARYIVDERDIQISAEDNRYLAALDALTELPEQDEAATMVKEKGEIKSVALGEDGKTAIVDFDSEKLGSGGSEEELCLIEQIVWTLTESFDEIDQVEFTVDGSTTETLMGHMDVTVPYGVISVDNGEGDGTDTVMPLYN